MGVETFSPQWASHVHGVFTREQDEDGKPEPTWVELSCDRCKARHRVHCASGAPRQHVLVWANLHLHRDPMDHQKFLESVRRQK